MAWNDNLTGQALAIASSNERRIRVIAGPGSGKTFSLMRKIARLLENGVEPQKILLVTFTRTAASDLKKEVAQLGIPRSEEVKAGTLHSFCYRMLQKSSVLELTGRNPRPLFHFETEFVIKDLMRVTGLNKTPIVQKIKALEAAWARLQTDTPGWPVDETDRSFQSSLVSYLKFHKAMLIEEVIPEFLKYLRNNGQADERTMFDYVFVDEYQDLNKAEQELLNILATNSHYMVIGDEDQSIYEKFRNAHPEGIRNFNLNHPGTVDYPLVVCRRCPIKIVKAADSFIQNNTNREDRHLIPNGENIQGKIHSIQWPSFTDEHDGIVAFIEHRINEGVNPGKILVMCPRKEIGYIIRDKLIDHSIEAHSFFTEEIFEDIHAQKAMSLFNLIINPYDRIALRSWVGFGSTTASASGYSAIMTFCGHNNLEPFDFMSQLSEGQVEIPHTSHIVERYNELKAILLRYSTLHPNEIVEEIFPRNDQWAHPFRKMLTEFGDDKTIAEMHSEILSNVINPEMPLDVDYVRIMSLHKSKGLTSEISIICGVVEGLIPMINKDVVDVDAEKFLEEQRRLFFVGITRPKSELVISSVRSIPKTIAYQFQRVPPTISSETPAIASSFLSQLGEDFPESIAGENWEF